MSDAYINIQIRRDTSIAVIASLLLHILMLFMLSRQDFFNQHLPAVEQPQPITVRLSPRTAPKPADPASPREFALPPPVIPPAVHRPKTNLPPPPNTAMPKVIATSRPESMVTPPPMTQQAPVPPKPATLDPGQFPDMISYLNAVREKRRMAGGGGSNEEASSQGRRPSEDEVRMANIQRNLQQPGTNGVFQISHLDAHAATFSFRGWKNEYSYSHREVYQVDAGLSGDIERAVVRKMIEIIRRYYAGDFNWESQRLGRVVVLSARLQDNDGLEDFMIQEFFGAQGISAR